MVLVKIASEVNSVTKCKVDDGLKCDVLMYGLEREEPLIKKRNNSSEQWEDIRRQTRWWKKKRNSFAMLKRWNGYVVITKPCKGLS